MDELALARRMVLANRRRRFQWQADASGPGTSGVSVVAPNGCAPTCSTGSRLIPRPGRGTRATPRQRLTRAQTPSRRRARWRSNPWVRSLAW
jgi:hypothetical protein